MTKRITLTETEIRFLLRLTVHEENSRNKADKSQIFAEAGLSRLIEKLDPTPRTN